MNPKHTDDQGELSMSEGSRSAGGLFRELVASMALCCGLPFLMGAGIALGAAGVTLGGGVVAAAALAVWGWRHKGRMRPRRWDGVGSLRR